MITRTCLNVLLQISLLLTAFARNIHRSIHMDLSMMTTSGMLAVRRTRAIHRLRRAVGPAEREQYRAELNIIKVLTEAEDSSTIMMSDGNGINLSLAFGEHADVEMQDGKSQEAQDESDSSDSRDLENVFAALHAQIEDLKHQVAVATMRSKNKDVEIQALVCKCDFLKIENQALLDCEASVAARQEELAAREAALGEQEAQVSARQQSVRTAEQALVWAQAEAAKEAVDAARMAKDTATQASLLDVRERDLRFGLNSRADSGGGGGDGESVGAYDVASSCADSCAELMTDAASETHSVDASGSPQGVSSALITAPPTLYKSVAQSSFIAWKLEVVTCQIASRSRMHRCLKKWCSTLQRKKRAERMLEDSRGKWRAFAEVVRSNLSA